MYSKTHKRAKQTKTKQSIQPTKRVKKMRDCVSVNVLISVISGLIAQMSGFLIKKRYMYTCVFVNHYSDLNYIHLLKTQSVNKVIEIKKLFETYTQLYSIDIKHYHADNKFFNF